VYHLPERCHDLCQPMRGNFAACTSSICHDCQCMAGPNAETLAACEEYRRRKVVAEGA
jgi:hypothetical protein